MRILQLKLKNYKSFKEEQIISLVGSRYAIIGRNNSGKSNILNAINLLLGTKDPRYITFDESYYNDISEELLIELTLGTNDVNEIWDLPTAQKNKAAFASKFKKDPKQSLIIITINQKLDGSIPDKFVINFGGLPVHQKVGDLRNALAKNVIAPPVRDAKDELSSSTWTAYGILMKTILENSPRYNELDAHLKELNILIEEILNTEKQSILNSSQLITFIEDLKFQLTKENKPSELLRNLELFIKEDGKYFHINDTGTGTQSSIIIAILEIALKYKTTKSKVLCIEEPELFIHPQGIRFLSQLLEKIIKETDCQVIVSSHSPIFISALDPRSIIRIAKTTNGSKVYQLPPTFIDIDNKIKRTLNSENSEMFFSSKVILVEGETEKIIFNILSQNLVLPDGKEVNYLKNNYSVCSVGGKENIPIYLEILKKYNIPTKAIVDNDFLDMQKTYSKICKDNGINKDLPREDLRIALKAIGVLALNEGETEDLIPNSDITAMTTISEEDILSSKKTDSKTSRVFEKLLFKKSKPECAYEIANYYLDKGSSPFDSLIKWSIE